MKCSLVFRNFDFWYNEKQILFNLNLEIPRNKITALIGPSGCGKSTMLRCMNRMNDLIPGAKNKGQIFYNGQDLCNCSMDVVELRKKIGMVFQKPNPFPKTIFENVAFGLRIQNGISKEEIEKKVRESLEKADLYKEVSDRLDLPAFRLSGGQQQRLCIARALAINPDILLLDEPCSSLDPISTARIECLLKQLKKETTIIIVTHNLQQAKRISDYTAYLLDGKIVEHSKTPLLFSNPRQKLTFEYINGEFG